MNRRHCCCSVPSISLATSWRHFPYGLIWGAAESYEARNDVVNCSWVNVDDRNLIIVKDGKVCSQVARS